MLTLAEGGSASQKRFLALAAKDEEEEKKEGGGTVWSIPTKVVWEGGGELVVMLEGGGGGDGDRKLEETLRELQTAGKWFKVLQCFLFVFVVVLCNNVNNSRVAFTMVRASGACDFTASHTHTEDSLHGLGAIFVALYYQTTAWQRPNYTVQW